ncbi:MAG TPA: hypothetical protein VMU31_04195 [Rhizomicrobium sp.]|nr:hypothetical protein [Rhizomicrobium sp.]
MRPAFILLLAVLAAGLSTPAMAQMPRAPGVQPLDRLLPEVRRSVPGQFYDADGPVPGPDGSPHYHLKWMTPDGRIEWLDTDARTGQVLGASPGRDNFDAPGARRNYAPAPSYPMPPRAMGPMPMPPRGMEPMPRPRFEGGGRERGGYGGGFGRGGGGWRRGR